DFFEHSWIIVREVDRFISEQARDLIWKHNLKPYDAIHLATALDLKLSRMDSFDSDLTKLSGKLGSPRLEIGPPRIVHTPDMFQQEKEEAAKAVAKKNRGRQAKKRRGNK